MVNPVARYSLLLAALSLVATPAAAQDESDALVAPPEPVEISQADFFRPGLAPVVHPRGHDLTIVYFMDYQCPSCRRYTPDVARLMAEDPNVRWIIRDTPILSEQSRNAASLALASTFQGKHDAFHQALMAMKGRLSPQRIRAAADRAAIDWPRLQADLVAHRTAIDAQIARNMELADATGINATPAFIIGDTLARGALDYAALKAEVAEIRRRKGISAPSSAATPVPEITSPVTATAPATGNVAPSPSPSPSPTTAAPPAIPPAERPAASPTSGEGTSRGPLWAGALLVLIGLLAFAASRRARQG